MLHAPSVGLSVVNELILSQREIRRVYTAAASDMDVTMFLVAAGVDWVRKGAAAEAQLNPLDPTMSDMIATFLANGGKILVCPPCAKVRGYDEQSLIDDAVIAGAPVMLEEIRAGAASLSF